MAAFIIGPKHELRQERLERMKDTRASVAYGVKPAESGDKPDKARPIATGPSPTLTERLAKFLLAAWPLKLFLAFVLSVGAVVKTMVQRRQRVSGT